MAFEPLNPNDLIQENWDWVEARLRKIEDELLKDLNQQQTRVAAGFAASLVILGAGIPARQTLFPGLLFAAHPVIWHLGWFFLSLEVVFFCCAIAFFWQSYRSIDVELPPKFENDALELVLGADEGSFKVHVLESLRESITKNKGSLNTSAQQTERGFAFLCLLVGSLFIHVFLFSFILSSYGYDALGGLLK